MGIWPSIIHLINHDVTKQVKISDKKHKTINSSWTKNNERFSILLKLCSITLNVYMVGSWCYNCEPPLHSRKRVEQFDFKEYSTCNYILLSIHVFPETKIYSDRSKLYRQVRI